VKEEKEEEVLILEKSLGEKGKRGKHNGFGFAYPSNYGRGQGVKPWSHIDERRQVI